MMAKAAAIEQLRGGCIPERYLRNIGTIGVTGQLKLLQAKVAVVGAGGLGGTLIELFARQGIGHIRVIDGDTFAAHNLNRQILATEKSLGEKKAIAAAARVAEVNPDVEVEVVADNLDAANAEQLIAGVDVVADALDSIETRLLLSRRCRSLGIPLVHAAIAGFSGQVTTILPSGPGLDEIYRCASDTGRGAEKVLGNPPPTPALAAAIQAQEVVKIITGVGETLSGRLLIFDTEYNIFQIIAVKG